MNNLTSLSSFARSSPLPESSSQRDAAMFHGIQATSGSAGELHAICSKCRQVPITFRVIRTESWCAGSNVSHEVNAEPTLSCRGAFITPWRVLCVGCSTEVSLAIKHLADCMTSRTRRSNASLPRWSARYGY